MGYGCSNENTADIDNLPYMFIIDGPTNRTVYYDIPDMDNFNLPYDINLMPMKLEADFLPHPTFEVDGDIYWESCTDGFLGRGGEIVVDLSLGKHKIYAKHSDEKVPDVKFVEIEVKKPEEYFYRHEVEKPRRIREVRGQDGRLLIADFDNDVIVDASTELMWMRRPVPYQFTFSEAIVYAQSYDYGGFNNWRLPTLQEFKDISNLHGDGRHATLNQVFTCRYGAYWTSTTYKRRGYFRDYVHIITKELVYARGYRYWARHTYSEPDRKFWVRLVRNDYR